MKRQSRHDSIRVVFRRLTWQFFGQHVLSRTRAVPRVLGGIVPVDELVAILDELCSGTNPSEGEEIFHLVLHLLAELGPEAFITTHFLTFARRLEDAPEEDLPLSFLQVQLDAHQRPTYGFVAGVAETSLAAQTAARLGVTREELMTLVRRNAARGRRP